VPVAETFRGVLPFLASDAVRLTLLVAFPPISLWLVRYIG
jgi:TRAP-type C4-dicarboxylate transport system permease large subunit